MTNNIPRRWPEGQLYHKTGCINSRGEGRYFRPFTTKASERVCT